MITMRAEQAAADIYRRELQTRRGVGGQADAYSNYINNALAFQQMQEEADRLAASPEWRQLQKQARQHARRIRWEKLKGMFKR